MYFETEVDNHPAMAANIHASFYLFIYLAFSNFFQTLPCESPESE